MADGGFFVYSCSRNAHEQITQLSDFISPTVVAMWNLRWQVQGFINAYPEASQNDIVQKFALGSGTRGNEIKRACIDNSWEDQQFRFASVLLTNTVAIFEDFAERLASINLSGENKKKVYKSLQYPNTPNGRGYQRAYLMLGANKSELDGVFNGLIKPNKWYSGPTLQNLLLCYRFFKETRNAIAHNGSIVNNDLVDAYNQFKPIATPVDLDIKEVPQHTAPIINNKVKLSLRGSPSISFWQQAVDGGNRRVIEGVRPISSGFGS